MSITTISSIVIAFALFFGAIFTSTDNFAVFADPASAMIVIGGTLSATFMSYEPRYALLSLKLIVRIIYSPKVGRNILKAEVGRIIKWAYTVQRNGLPALEAEAKKAPKSDKFLRFGIEMVVSGYTGDEVREILNTMIESTYVRNTVQVNILKAMGGSAPAFGMVGTLIGLVVMLDKMASDPSQLGPNLAIALITTLYGLLLARLVFMPAASKILQREQIVRFRNFLVAEGLALLADRKSPRFIQDKMNSYLDPALHFNIDKMKR